MADNPSPEAREQAIRCFSCPCGCIGLRWRQALLMHFDRGDVKRMLDCLEDVLEEPGCGLSLGESAFCACYARDGYYYLVCRDQVVLRLSGDEARVLHSELAMASQVGAQIGSRVM